MPPVQCPECGRFLANAFVMGLLTEPNDCPKCGTRLSAANFPDKLGQAAAPDGPAEEPAAAAELRSDEPPPATPGDPLWDWDGGGPNQAAPSEPVPDAAVIAGSGAAGALLGALLSRRRVSGAVMGLLWGVLAAAVARQVWRLPD